MLVEVRLEQGCLGETGPCHLSTHIGVLLTLNRHAIVDVQGGPPKFHPDMEKMSRNQCEALREAYSKLRHHGRLSPAPEIICRPGLAATEIDPQDPAICSVAALQNLSQAMARCQRLATTSVEPGDRASAVWQTRIRPVAQHSDRLVVFDRYEGGWFAKHVAQDVAGSAKKPCGFAWLLARIAEMDSADPPFSVRLITMAPKDPKFGAHVARWADANGWTEARGRPLEIWTWPNDDALTKTDPQKYRFHDRYLAFGVGLRTAVFSLGRGIGGLRKEIVDESTATDMIYDIRSPIMEPVKEAFGLQELPERSVTRAFALQNKLNSTAPTPFTKLFPPQLGVL